MSYAEAGHAMGVHPNSLRYGTTTGRILIRWEGARRPLIWTVPAPEMSVEDARLELARRYLHVLGPGTADAFGDWAGIRPARASRIVDALAADADTGRDADRRSLDPDDATRPRSGRRRGRSRRPSASCRAATRGSSSRAPIASCWSRTPRRRPELWTPRVWPGALLVDGEVRGTWRRANAVVDIDPWGPLSPADRQRVEAEAASLPLPGIERDIRVRWGG